MTNEEWLKSLGYGVALENWLKVQSICDCCSFFDRNIYFCTSIERECSTGFEHWLKQEHTN